MKVGDYVRTYFGIAKIVKINKNTVIVDEGIDVCDEGRCNHLLKIYIVKSSPNIIDLIEVGDYVNGIYIEENNGKYLETLEDDYDNSRLGHIEFIKIYPYEIKSIVTREQFERMEYKIND